jgi:hypothetical protein
MHMIIPDVAHMIVADVMHMIMKLAYIVHAAICRTCGELQI